ncbi:MAG: PAS domain S-box protein [Anaerolineales bacterium]
MLPTLYYVAVTTSACILAALSIFTWTQRHRSGAWPLHLIITGYMFAMLLHSLSLISNTAELVLEFNLVAELAYLTHPVHVLWLSLAIQQRDWRPARIIIPLYALALGLVAVVWTNNAHGWFVVDYSIHQFGEFSLLSRSLGWWYNITSIFAVITQFTAIGILLVGIRSAKGRLRRQLSLILLAITIPLTTLFVVAVVDVAGADPIIRYPARMGAMIVTSVVLVFVFVRCQPLNLTPIALPLIFSEIPDPIIIVDEHQRITDLNRAACLLKGVNERQAIGQSLTVIFPELVGAQHEEDLAISNTQGQTLYFVWITRELTRGGDTIGMLHGLRDVTRRKQAEDELRQEQFHLRSLVQTETAFVMRTDMAGNYTYVNQAFADWSGYAIEDMLGTPVMDTIALLDHEKADTAGHAAITQPGKPVRVSLSKILAEGSQRQVMWEYIALTDEDGEVIEIQCMGFDVTEQHALQQALEASEERQRTIVDNIPIMIGFFNQAGQVEFVNRHWVEALGGSAEELAAYDEPLAVVYPDPDDRQQVMDFMLSAEPGWHDFETLTKSGETLITSWANVRLSDGRIIGIGQDITERTLAQKHETELHLEQERRRLLTTFFQNAAHEFRTPLSIILTSAQLILRVDDPERRTQKAERIEAQIERITRLVDSLLLMTHLASNGSPLTDVVDTKAAVQKACQNVTNEYATRHHLHFEIPPDLPTVMGQSDYLSAALAQILDNACRFTPPGGEIVLQAGHKDAHIYVEIRDNGPGIASADLPQVFETFWRKDSAHTTPGFGLGLPIAQRIIQQHGGEITLTSQEGSGTTVRVTLPTAPEHDKVS